MNRHANSLNFKKLNKISWFINDFFSRHKHPLNILLHLTGIPEVIFGIYQIIKGVWQWGLFNVFWGYLLQWFGHWYWERNEMGEIILIRKITGKYRRHNNRTKRKGRLK